MAGCYLNSQLSRWTALHGPAPAGSWWAVMSAAAITGSTSGVS